MPDPPPHLQPAASLPLPVVSAAQAALAAEPAPLAGPLNPLTWAERPLYGGAITACIPKRFVDCSDFRHIPDHQEVWADGDADQSLIVELNTLDEEVKDEDAASHYMRELGVANDAHSSEQLGHGLLTAQEMPGFSPAVHKSFCISAQRVSKYKEDAAAANEVHIYMAVVRLRNVGTDLLVSFNAPRAFADASSSAGRQILHSDENRAVIEGVLHTLTVRDWQLFGSS